MKYLHVEFNGNAISRKREMTSAECKILTDWCALQNMIPPVFIELI